MDDYIPLVVFVVAVIDLLAAFKFSDIAKMKGHLGYFWWCFLLGPVGWAMVIALPDRGPVPSDGTQRDNKTAPETDNQLPKPLE